MIRFLISICFLFCLLSCKYENFAKEPIRYPSPNKMYERDSMYLSYTIKFFNDNNVLGYGTGMDFMHADIDTILYSPDTLKLFAFVISFIKNDIATSKMGYHINGQTIIGFRENTKTPWVIYPNPFAVFLGYENYNMMKNRLREEYFNRQKDQWRWYWNNALQKREAYYFYNVNIPKFWDSCVIWKKGLSIPGYYQFQLTGNVTPDDVNAIWKLPNLRYPDSLIKLFY